MNFRTIYFCEKLDENGLMDETKANAQKIDWSGRIVAVQPRIRLTCSFSERHHTYQGYVLRLDGICGNTTGEFTIAVGKAAHEKHRFREGMELSGVSVLVRDRRLETAEHYKTSGIKIAKCPEDHRGGGSPFICIPPDLPTYRERGHRRLATRTYAAKCGPCIWGAKMPVEIIVDHWNPSVKKHRFETFCYGPKSCSLYRAGAIRKVPGRGGMTWEEEDWVDEDATSHRGPDD